MKTLLSTSFCLHLLLITPGLAQTGGNPATPPANVGPTMKTLDQIEARTPLVQGATGVSVVSDTVTLSVLGQQTQLDTVNITITEPGSYYLTKWFVGNQTAPAISIQSSNVTLDLNGFSIRGFGGTAVEVRASTNVFIKNGSIEGLSAVGNFVKGITMGNLGNTPIHARNVRVSGVSFNDVGTAIDLTGRSLVSACMVSGTTTGIKAQFVQDCSVGTSGVGIEATSVHRCVVSSSGAGAIIAEIVHDCFGESGSTAASGVITAGFIVDSSRQYTGGSSPQRQNIRDTGQTQ